MDGGLGGRTGGTGGGNEGLTDDVQLGDKHVLDDSEYEGKGC